MSKGVRTVIGMVIAIQSTVVLADDYKEATEAAYCIGVYQSDVEGETRMYRDPKNADTHNTEMKQFRKQAFVEGAIKRRIIDEVTVSKMKDVGYADGKSFITILQHLTIPLNGTRL
jgi:hypothetical protein